MVLTIGVQVCAITYAGGELTLGANDPYIKEDAPDTIKNSNSVFRKYLWSLSNSLEHIDRACATYSGPNIIRSRSVGTNPDWSRDKTRTMA